MNPLPKWFLLLFRYEGVRVDNVQHLQVLHLFVFFEYYGYFPFAKCLVAPFERNFSCAPGASCTVSIFNTLAKIALTEILFSFLVIIILYYIFIPNSWAPNIFSWKDGSYGEGGFIPHPDLLTLGSYALTCVSYSLGLDMSCVSSPGDIS